MASLMSWIQKQIGMKQDKGPESEEIKALTTQFYVSLKAYLSAIETRGGPTDTDKTVFERIKALAEKSPDDRTWQDAYDLEQQLILFYDDQTLETELSRRLVEAEASLQPEVSRWYQDAVSQAKDSSERRAIMTRLVNDIQWRYTKTEARRGYSKQITKRTELVFTASVFVFAAVLVLIVSGNHDLNHPILMAFVGAAGAFGATFSMMTTLRRHLDGCTFDDLKLNRSWGLILARVLVGIGASFVLYFAVSSALLSGEAFPALPLVNGEGGATPGQDFAKLFIWSFISGFSEKLIPSVLARTEGQAGERDQSRPKDEDRSTTPRDRHAEAQPLQGAGMSPPAAAS